MFIDFPSAQHELAHNLINLFLFPNQHLRIGQSDRYAINDADIVLERTGNLYSSGRDAITYRYSFDGPGFSLCLLAIWTDPNQATADVHVMALSPQSAETQEAAHTWMTSVVQAKMTPRDLFANSARWSPGRCPIVLESSGEWSADPYW